MTDHTQFAEELTQYLLGELPPAARGELEQHLGRCGECRTELEKLRAAEALLALSVPQMAPPPHSRARLMTAIAREPRMQVVVAGSHSRPWWFWVPVAATLALAIAVGVLWKDNAALREESNQMTAMIAQQELDAQKAKEILSDMTATGSMHMNVSEAGSPRQAHGKAVYNPKDGGVVFMASNLSQLPEGQVYQLWIVPVSGGDPIPAGSFTPNSHGTAVVLKHDVPRTKPGMFAVTVEAKQGIKELSSPVVMVSDAGE